MATQYCLAHEFRWRSHCCSDYYFATALLERLYRNGHFLDR